MPWQWPVGALCAFLLTLVTTPAGVSGAVLLLPIQLSVLHVPSPSVTPTNLLFNVASVPVGLLRFRHERRLLSPLTWLLVSGTLPGVVAGAIIRVELLSGRTHVIAQLHAPTLIRPDGRDQDRKVGATKPFFDADERTRTSTSLPRHGPEPCASTNSATSAGLARRYRTRSRARSGAAGFGTRGVLW